MNAGCPWGALLWLHRCDQAWLYRRLETVKGKETKRLVEGPRADVACARVCVSVCVFMYRRRNTGSSRQRVASPASPLPFPSISRSCKWVWEDLSLSLRGSPVIIRSPLAIKLLIFSRTFREKKPTNCAVTASREELRIKRWSVCQSPVGKHNCRAQPKSSELWSLHFPGSTAGPRLESEMRPARKIQSCKYLPACLRAGELKEWVWTGLGKGPSGRFSGGYKVGLTLIRLLRVCLWCV